MAKKILVAEYRYWLKCGVSCKASISEKSANIMLHSMFDFLDYLFSILFEANFDMLVFDLSRWHINSKMTNLCIRHTILFYFILCFISLRVLVYAIKLMFNFKWFQVGTSLGATRGLLLRGGNVLEKFSMVNTVVFDKTGTLTMGKPVVTKILTPEHAEVTGLELSTDRNLLSYMIIF